MDEQTRLHDLLGHVVEWSEEFAAIIDGFDCDRFMSDRLARLSVWRRIDNAGEAASRILKLFRDFAGAQHELQLNEARAMRNQLTHGSDGVDFEVVWLTAVRSVPPMVEAARTFLARHGSP